jgi:PAS domain S-box-containing protein
LLLFLAVLLNVLTCYAAGQQPSSKNVLVLFSSIARSSEVAQWDPVEPLMRARVVGQITFHHAYLEEEKLKDESYRESQAETFRRTYDGVKLDLLIATNPEELRFAVLYRDKIFPGVPIVFTGVSAGELEGQQMWRSVTGVTVPVGIRETIALALRLQPDTTTVVVISGTSVLNKHWWAVTHAELLRYRDKLTEIDLAGSPSHEMLDRVAALPPHTIVLFQQGPEGSSRPAFGTRDLLAAVSQRLPTYSAWPSLCLNYGCIGGAYEDWPRERSLTGEMAARVLSGERPEDIPIVNATNLQVQVDWRALRRWNIPDSALPPGSVVLYREPTLWERDREYFLVGAAVIVVQTLLIVGLLWQRARKRKAEAILRESEKRFRVMADTTPALIWMCDDKGNVTYLNERRLSFTGSDPNAGYGQTWKAYIYPDDLKNVLDTLSRALKRRQPFSQQYRLRRQDGAYRWMFDVASPRVDGSGSFAGFIGSAVDVTDPKIAQEALEKVNGQLIEAQEKERSRLARELHDDICQRLAMLSLKIEKVNIAGARGQVSVADQLEQIWQECSDLTADVQSLSHELHPSILDNLGLATAVKSFCREVSEQNGVVVEFVEANIPRSLPRDVSLSLFRVVQEAVHNAIKYSGEKQFEVHLRASDTEIELEVTDRGVGFDAARKSDRRGLGLVSMAERIHQVNGTFNIDSQLNRGTRIQARVPVAAQPSVMIIASK